MAIRDPADAILFKIDDGAQPLRVAEELLAAANQGNRLAMAEVAGCAMVAHPGASIPQIMDAWRKKLRINSPKPG